MKDALVYFSIFWAFSFVILGLYLRYKYKDKLDDLSKKFLEMKSLALKYKENKDIEIEKLNSELDKFKKMIEESNNLYESMLDRTTKSLEKIIEKTESESQIQ